MRIHPLRVDHTVTLLAMLIIEPPSSHSTFVSSSCITLQVHEQASKGVSSTGPAVSLDQSKVDGSLPSGGPAVRSLSQMSTPETSLPAVTKKLTPVMNLVLGYIP